MGQFSYRSMTHCLVQRSLTSLPSPPPPVFASRPQLDQGTDLEGSGAGYPGVSECTGDDAAN